MDWAVHTEQLTKRYGPTTALDRLSLSVPTGKIVGYLGPNGSGKTTTIRLLLGLLRPTSGHASVLGMDVGRHRRQILQSVGYLPSGFVAPPHLTARDYLRRLANLRGVPCDAVAQALAERLDLPFGRRMDTLSHGNLQKVGLIQAFMHMPPLVILDEPTSGLDPLVQLEFLDILRQTRDDGRTVLLSSHVLSEVDAVADTVAILRGGRLVAMEDVTALRSRTRRRLDIIFSHPPPVEALRQLPEVRQAHLTADRSATVVVEGSMADFWRVAAPYGVVDVHSHEGDIQDMFLDHYRQEHTAEAVPA